MPDIPPSIRSRHVHIVGKTGSGKSTLLTWWAYNDIESNEGGVCVIDPKGDLVEHILRVVPKEREKDCIWIDIDDPLPLDFMSCARGEEQSVVADLKYILTAGMLDTANAPTLSANIENLIYTLLNANFNPTMPKEERCTFLDIADFLEDQDRQDFILSHVTDSRLKRCWKERLPKADQARILSRINPFIRSTTLSKVFGDPNPRLNMRDVIDQNKILLVRVPIDNPSSATYGALLVSKLRQAAFVPSRLQQGTKPYFLYIDEFEFFRATEDFDRFLKMARGYNLCLTLANLQVSELDPRIQSALGIISSYILFKIDDKDASFYRQKIESRDPAEHIRELYEKELLNWNLTHPDLERDGSRYRLNRLREMTEALPPPPLTIQDAIDLPRFKAIYKIDDEPSVIEDSPTPMSAQPTSEQILKMDWIRAKSKVNYGTSAQSGTKRSGGAATCNSSPMRQDEDDDQEPQPGGSPTPHHERQKRSS
jgi:hypothetical protein